MTLLEPSGVIGIVRLKLIEPSDGVFEALIAGGINSIEVTLPTPGSCAAIARWRATGQGLVGAGTVRSTVDVARAVDAGAQFLVTPTISPPVLEAAAAAGIPVVCGALSPSEIDSASRAGANLVKIFPIESVGGLAYLKAIAAPLAEIRFVPTGGVDPNAARDYAAFGCAGVGVGSALVDETTVATAQWRTIQDRAIRFTTSWREGKAGRG